VINQTNTSGKGDHLHSFEVSVQRPFTKGLSVFAAYAYQREQTQEFFDDLATYARRFEWRDTDTPRQRFTTAVSWDIPIGKGRAYFNSVPKGVDYIVGGWTLTTSTRIYSGRPLFFNQNLIVTGSPKISNPTQTAWFDTTKFSQIPTSTDPALPPIESTEPGAAAPAQAVQRDSGYAVTSAAARSGYTASAPSSPADRSSWPRRR
jgi:hypothetical protein